MVNWMCLEVVGACTPRHYIIWSTYFLVWLKSGLSVTNPSLVTQREWDIELFHLPLHSPNGCNDHSRASAQSRAWSFFWVPHLGAGAQPLGLSTAAFPGALALRRVRNVATGTPTSPLMECWCLVQRCNLLCQGTGPVILYKWPY